MLTSKSFINFLDIHSLNNMGNNRYQYLFLGKLVIWLFNAKWSRNDPKLALNFAQNSVFDILHYVLEQTKL